MENKNYSEGSLIAIPLRDKGYGLGLIARKQENIALGYFFKYKSEKIPKEIDPSIISKKNSILIRKFGSLGIDNGSWKIIGQLKEWAKNDWGIPKFKMIDPLTEEAICIEYNDHLQEVTRSKISKENSKSLYDSSTAGYGAIEIILTKLLSQ